MTTKNVFMYFQTSFGMQWGGLAKLSLVEVHYLRRINEDKIPNLISAIPKCMFFSLLHFLKALGIASFLNGNQYPFWSLGWYQSQFLTATLDSVSTLLKFYGLSGDSFTCVWLKMLKSFSVFSSFFACFLLSAPTTSNKLDIFIQPLLSALVWWKRRFVWQVWWWSLLGSGRALGLN